MPVFDYRDEEALGRVQTVDTANAVVRVANVDLLRQMQVNRLVALQSTKPGQHLIGVVQKITRSLADASAEVEVDDPSPGEHGQREINLVRIALIGTLIDKLGTKPNVFRRTLETVPEIEANCFAVEGERLSRFMQAVSHMGATDAQKLSLGHYTLDEGAEALLNGNRLFQRHAVVVGSTGSGKSWTTARLLEQVATLPNADAILFDVHGEYGPLSGNGFRHLRVAGPGDGQAGASLENGVIYLPYWMLTYEEMLAMLLDRSDQNAPNQAMVFSRAVKSKKREYLERIGKPEVLANFTIDSPVPYSVDDILADLDALNKEMVAGSRGDKQGEFYGKLGRFILRLENKISDRRLHFLFGGGADTMEYDWLSRLATLLMAGSRDQQDGKGGVKIIDFSEVPSDVLPLMVSLVARLVFSVQQWTKRDKRHPIAIFCDEAHLYIPERTDAGGVGDASLRTFQRISKEGRKYGVGLAVISQRPSEVCRTVMSQCNNFVAMRLTNADDQAVIRRLLPDSLGGFVELLPVLDVGEALVVGDASLLPSRVRIQEPDHKPDSKTINFWDCWSKDESSATIADAVHALRCQSRGA